MGLFDNAGLASALGTAGTSFGGPIGGLLGAGAGALVSGVGSFLGQQQSNAQNAASQQRSYFYDMGLQNNANAQNVQNATTAFNRSQEQLAETEQYNTSMANTAFQRQVADLKAAGLNPILGMGTSGAPSPIASTAPPASPTMGAGTVGSPLMQSGLSAGIASAQQGARLFNELKLSSAQADQAAAQADQAGSIAKKTAAEAAMTPQLLGSQISSNLASAGYSNSAAQLAGQQGIAAAAAAEKTRKETEYVGADRTTYDIGAPGFGGVKRESFTPKNLSPQTQPYNPPNMSLSIVPKGYGGYNAPTD